MSQKQKSSIKAIGEAIQAHKWEDAIGKALAVVKDDPKSFQAYGLSRILHPSWPEQFFAYLT